MVFDNFIIQGFCSTEFLEINLNQKGITLIKGPTGSGKSNILSALVWTLYGKNLKGYSEVNLWSKYRTKDYKGTVTTLYFRNSGHVYKIIRCQNFKDKIDDAIGGNRLLFYQDATLVDLKKKIEIQSAITKALGMSYDLFMNAIMFGQGLKRLIQEDSSDQKNLFEEIFNFGYISKGKEIAKQKYSLVNQKYLGAQDIYKNTNNALDVIQNTLEKAKEEARRFENQTKQTISELKEYKNEATIKYKELSDKVATMPDFKEIQKLKEDLKEAKEKEVNLKDKKNSLTIEGLLKQVLEYLKEKEYDKCKKNIELIIKDFNALEVTRKYIEDLKEKLEDLKEKEFKVKLQKEKLSSLESNISSYKRRIEQMKNAEPPKIGEDLKEKEAKYKEELTKLKIDLDKYKEEVETLKWVFTEPLGNNGLKAYLFDTSMGELNKILEGYTDHLGISIQFVMDTSNARKDFNSIIKMDGMIVLYEELSGGQKQLVNLAMAFAMNELKGINIAFLDEVFENLSFDYIEIVISLLRKIYKDKTLFMITHQDSLPMGNTRTINVSRNKGISSYNF